MVDAKNKSDFSEDEFHREVYKSILGKEPSDTGFEEKDYRSIAEAFEIESLEADLNLPKGFFQKLLDEDDWSFIIKLHALIEASFTHLLVEHFNQSSLKEIFSYLELSNSRTGKITFASSLGLIDTDIKRFVQKLSEMRNAFVHDVTNVSVRIEDFFSELDDSAKKGYRTGFLFGYKDKQHIQLKVGEDTYDRKKLIQLFCVATFEHAPKLSIWFGSLTCLSQIYNHVILSQIRVQKNEMNDRIATLLEQIAGTSQLSDATEGDEETSM